MYKTYTIYKQKPIIYLLLVYRDIHNLHYIIYYITSTTKPNIYKSMTCAIATLQ